MKQLSLLTSFFFITSFVFAQNDTLPKFTAIKKRTGEIVLSWNSPYKNVSQINIQRSKDSLRSFSTIHSLSNPNVKSYSYIDKTAKNDSGYYRIFILFEGTNYIFTASRKLFIDTTKEVVIVAETPVKQNKPVVTTPKEKEPVVKEEKPQPPPKPVWVPSVYVFTGDDGNPVIRLPEAATKKYSIRFMKEDGTLLFTIPKITQVFLTLDKVNFMRSGWYHFELLEEGKLKEKNKFLITRDY
ncbi:MAG: hypothetical protein ACOVP7_06770 [Lacibacter sp.]